MRRTILLLLPLIWFATSCARWQRAECVIAAADSLDVTQRVLYDDTMALRQAIYALNNPLGRAFKRSTLAKAYYYMGRNLHRTYEQVERAAECYIEADWLKIDDPLYQGRVNSCMGAICMNYNEDSLSLLFYERALESFERSGNEWYYANGLLNICMIKCGLQQFAAADSLWQMAVSYSFDDNYYWYLNDVRAVYFYYQNLSFSPDSIIRYLRKNPIINSYRATKLSGAFYDLGQMDSAAYYAEKVVNDFDVPDNKVSAYYILHKYAILNNDISAADSIAGLRMDEKCEAEVDKIDSLNAIQVFRDYLHYCETFIWRVIGYTAIVILLIVEFFGVLLYWRRKKKHVETQAKEVQLAKEEYCQTVEEQYQHRRQALLQHVEELRKRYPIPDKKWNDYTVFRSELNQSLLCLLDKLSEQKLSEKEIRLCVYCILYYDVSTKILAEYMIYSAVGIRTFKQRTAQKLGTTAANLYDFLVELAIAD